MIFSKLLILKKLLKVAQLVRLSIDIDQNDHYSIKVPGNLVKLRRRELGAMHCNRKKELKMVPSYFIFVNLNMYSTVVNY